MATVFAPEVIEQAITAGFEYAAKAVPDAHPAHQAAADAAMAGLDSLGGGAVAGITTAAGVHAARITFHTVAKALALAILARAVRRTTNLAATLGALYGDGYVQGAKEAATAAGGHLPPSIAAAASEIPNGDWVPGTADEVVAQASGGLAELLANRGITMAALTETQVNRIGDIIGQGIADGFPIKRVTGQVNAIVNDPARARLIAETEYARAKGDAAMETYESNNVPGKAWLHEPGACARCMVNAAASPLPLATPWPEGNIPLHPHERCAVAPVMVMPKPV